MKIHNAPTVLNGIICIQLQAQFVGDTTDANDRLLIAALGDPEVNLGGTFTDTTLYGTPSSPFVFQMPSTEFFAGITTEMGGQVARFMSNLPAPTPGCYPTPVQGPLDVVTPFPTKAAQVWVATMVLRIQNAMASLRSQILLPTISDSTV